MKKNVTVKKTGFQRDTAVFRAIHTTTKDSLLIRHCPRKAWFAPALHGNNSSKFSSPPPQNHSYGVHCYNAITLFTYSGKHLYSSHLPPDNRTSNVVTKSWSTALFEQLGSSVVKKFPAFYGTRRFITAYSRASTCLS
jgi:hypothetical protein